MSDGHSVDYESRLAPVRAMTRYVLTGRAKLDTFEIWAYIAVDSETVANRVEQALYDACAFLAETP